MNFNSIRNNFFKTPSQSSALSPKVKAGIEKRVWRYLNSPVFALTCPLRDEAIMEDPFAYVVELGIRRVALYTGIEVTPACY
jgi:hypothetical protein